ncbi:hypothetical protein [Nonomuraea pusilla]|uniref:hypothetical protein n=1 Tax=Nonomuraea pusilla TaxID=46177 RepID=UPI0006E461B3|nr:hypothetical protein [Nonomuraea pusilla]
MDLHELAAALRRDVADIDAYVGVLLGTLGEVLPIDCVSVQREQGLTARLRGRDGRVRALAVRLGDRVLTLAASDGRPMAEVAHEVHGVTLSRRTVTLDVWVELLAELLARRADADAAAAEALRRLIHRGHLE